MTQNKMHPEINNGICEAIECFADATTEIVLQVGTKGRILVNLCKDCAKNKFGHTPKGN
jgi:hypothetical protein